MFVYVCKRIAAYDRVFHQQFHVLYHKDGLWSGDIVDAGTLAPFRLLANIALGGLGLILNLAVNGALSLFAP